MSARYIPGCGPEVTEFIKALGIDFPVASFEFRPRGCMALNEARGILKQIEGEEV
jgi:hypothetical protein